MNWEGEAVGGNLVICRVVSERDKLLSHNLITLVPPLFNEHGCTELLFLTNKNKILLRVLFNSCVVPPQFLTCAPSVQWIWMHGTFVPLIKICFLFYYFLCCGVMPSTQDRVFPRVFFLGSSQTQTWGSSQVHNMWPEAGGILTLYVATNRLTFQTQLNPSLQLDLILNWVTILSSFPSNY